MNRQWEGTMFKKRESENNSIRPKKRSGKMLLTYAIVLFQFSALFLLGLKTQPIDGQALLYSVLFPLGTLLLSTLLPRIWHVDRVLLSLMLFIIGTGMVIQQDITKTVTSAKHAFFFIPGVFVLLVSIIAIRNLTKWEKLVPLAILVSLGLLALPLAFGVSKYGARNWINVAGVSLQPSEFVKIILVFVLASAFSLQRGVWRTIPALIFAVLCCVMLLAQSDLGSLLIFFIVTICMFYISTSNLLLTGIGVGAASIGAVTAYNLFSHVRVRVDVWQNPWIDTDGKGYQIVQALIAIGSGGMFGMGLGLGLPRIVPLYHSDFVFAAISEEFGTMFAICLLAAYGLVLWRGMMIALSARKGFHTLLAVGMTLTLVVQTFIIVGGVIKMIPLTGVTLPLISAGGSSILSCMGQFGVLLGISSINYEDDINEMKRHGIRGGV